MKKFLYVFAIIGLIWLCKLSYDAFVFSRQLTEVKESLHKTEQTNAMLNDRLIAIQRNSEGLPIQQNRQQNDPVKKQLNSSMSPSVLLGQKLDLIKFALEQNQLTYALEMLNDFDLSIEKYALADTLKQSLHKAVLQDKKQIQQYVVAKNSQIAQLSDVLEWVDLSLKKELKNDQLSLSQSSELTFWQRWFKVDRVEEQTPAVLNRKLILKEIQLRIIFAQQALMKGQDLEYQNTLDAVIQEIDQLPDAYSGSLKKNLINLKQTQILSVPQLSSAAILE